MGGVKVDDPDSDGAPSVGPSVSEVGDDCGVESNGGPPEDGVDSGEEDGGDVSGGGVSGDGVDSSEEDGGDVSGGGGSGDAAGAECGFSVARTRSSKVRISRGFSFIKNPLSLNLSCAVSHPVSGDTVQLIRFCVHSE